jgi:hypothetical protein
MALTFPLKEFLFREQTIAASINGRTCAFDAKILYFSGVRFWLSRCRVRNRNFFKNLPILQKLPTDLIEK